MNGGGFILAGSTASNPNSGEDIWLIKTDRKGRMQWDRTFGGENDDSAHSIQKTGGGGYIVTGEMGSNADGEKDAFLLKTDAQGRLADRGYSKE